MKSAADKITAGLGDAIAFANGEKGRGRERLHRAADDVCAASASAPLSDRLHQPEAALAIVAPVPDRPPLPCDNLPRTR